MVLSYSLRGTFKTRECRKLLGHTSVGKSAVLKHFPEHESTIVIQYLYYFIFLYHLQAIHGLNSLQGSGGLSFVTTFQVPV